MKTFVITLVIFALLLAVIITNFLYIRHVSADLLALAEGLPAEPTGGDVSLSRLETHWRRNRSRIGFSISYTTISSINARLASLRAACACADVPGYAREKALLIEELRDLGRLETLSLALPASLHGDFTRQKVSAENAAERDTLFPPRFLLID